MSDIFSFVEIQWWLFISTFFSECGVGLFAVPNVSGPKNRVKNVPIVQVSPPLLSSIIDLDSVEWTMSDTSILYDCS